MLDLQEFLSGCLCFETGGICTDEEFIDPGKLNKTVVMSNCVVKHVPANQINCTKTLKYQNIYVQEYPLTSPVALKFVIIQAVQLQTEPKHVANLRALHFCK
jgi:hypothetical protein